MKGDESDRRYDSDAAVARITPAQEAEAERQADVHSGRAFEWQTGQDAYERWLNEITP